MFLCKRNEEQIILVFTKAARIAKEIFISYFKHSDIEEFWQKMGKCSVFLKANLNSKEIYQPSHFHYHVEPLSFNSQNMHWTGWIVGWERDILFSSVWFRLLTITINRNHDPLQAHFKHTEIFEEKNSHLKKTQ